MKDNKYVYIGYRNLPFYLAEQAKMGGVPKNSDLRLTVCKSGAYLLTFEGLDYAVSVERAEEFTADVLSRCTGKNRGFFPTDVPALADGKQFAAVIEVREGRDYYYYDMDDEVLLQMLTALKDECGAPLDRRGMINHCYPNPDLPEGDFELNSIWHKIFIYDDTPVSVMRSYTPDTRSSYFQVMRNEAHLDIREENTVKKYDVPAELIPEIKSKVRRLCADPAEAYVENGSWESFVKFGEDGEERIFTKPDETYGLLKEIASKSVLKETEELKSDGAGPISSGSPFGFTGMMGFTGISDLQTAAANQAPAPVPATTQPNNGKFCINCGTPRNGNKFCSECGAKFD